MRNLNEPEFGEEKKIFFFMKRNKNKYQIVIQVWDWLKKKF